MIRRRDVLVGGLALPMIARARAKARVVVVGGGFGGATLARFVRMLDPSIDVTLIDGSEKFVACPFSNLVIAGDRSIARQTFDQAPARAHGISFIKGTVEKIDAEARSVTVSGGAAVAYDRLILSPGIAIDWRGLPGYDEAAANVLPHAWQAGAQTLLLRRQLEAMPDGGVVVMSVPPNPYRCPPGPYERASLIAWYLKKVKPRSKIIILDAKDTFSKQKLFQAAWQRFYPDMLEWVSLSDGGKVVRVDAATKTFETDFGSHKADVGIVVPPQFAASIAAVAADKTGWCPIDPITFESKIAPKIHVIGDAAIAGAMPKSAFAANAQAKVCAQAVVALLRGEQPEEPRLINTCYSVATPDYGFSVAGVYKPVNGMLTDIEGAGGTSPVDAPDTVREQEARFGERWFHTITSEAFG